MYIRTKDGRIIDTAKIATGSKYMDFATNDESFRKIFKTEPLSKSENLEELVDGYYMDKGTEFILADLLGKDCNDVLRRNITFLSHKKIIVKAFIKTERELKFVAKMNDKGELELI